jgi:putative endonuclease
MRFFVYILFSGKTEKFYTGQTQDITNRLEEHNNGETTSLKTGIPWKLVWSYECSSRSEAMKLESKIKKRGAKRFLGDLSRGA